MKDKLKKSGLAKFFIDFESFGGTGLQKWQNISLIIERNCLDRAVYIGDIQSDCDAAKAAGIPFIHASYGFGTVDTPDMSVSRFDGLLSLI